MGENGCLRQMPNEEKQVKRQKLDYDQIAYEYYSQVNRISAELPESSGGPFVPPPGMVLPPGLKVPESMKHSAIIERTALFFHQQAPQMEILMELKFQGKKNFAFLSNNDPLHEFYKHVRSLIKSGSYVPASQEPFFDKNPDDLSAGEEFERPELINKLIEIVASFVVRNGPDFERSIMSRNDERFHFIRTTDKYHSLYRSVLINMQKIHNKEPIKNLQIQNVAERELLQEKNGIKKLVPLKKRPYFRNQPKESKGLEVPSALSGDDSSDEDK